MTLSVSGLNISYGSRRVISDIHLPALPKGSLVAVVGPNAVGKSTLLKSFAGLVKYSGDIHYEQQTLSAMPRAQLIRTLGYLPQALPQAISLVAYEVVYSACRAVRTDLTAAQVEASIEQVFDRLGIRDLALRRLSEMSGGQRQMVGLAQVLVRQPKLLLLDEPTSALDLHWQLNVLEAIRDETADAGAIALVASHDLNLALRFCDYVLILARQGLLALVKPEELTPAHLEEAYGVEGRIETCSQGFPIVLADRALSR
ncbi:ABC transporter ATP-binding protein [Litoribrevibacter euphylliae]|uniref:ABC transporter ATP-binding protein n=1 Tax=Litoribrevibacter euphylliae TaxID=1834034 RepID=A0ABV7HM48_9GAMM